jgi:hypothetical protein
MDYFASDRDRWWAVMNSGMEHLYLEQNAHTVNKNITIIKFYYYHIYSTTCFGLS